jgi:hypothetical protein
MSIRDRLGRLERGAAEDIIAMPQANGPPAKFPAAHALDAFLSSMERLRAHHLGEEVPEEHPLTRAARASSDPAWHGSFFALAPDEEDRSE